MAAGAAEPAVGSSEAVTQVAAVGLVMPQVTFTWGTYQVCDAPGGPSPPPRLGHCT